MKKVIECCCIDCGGTEPGHATGCTYMRDLHGQEANFGGLAQGEGGSANMLTQPFDTVDVSRENC